MKVEEFLKNYLTSKSDLEHAKHTKEISLEIYFNLKEIFPNNHLLNCRYVPPVKCPKCFGKLKNDAVSR